MHHDFSRNYFELFGLPARFRLDAAVLDECYRELQSAVHPDRFAHLPEAERRVAMQWATQVNEAYRTLKNPVPRALYLLSLKGVDAGTEANSALPAEFLIEQMEWREAVMEARGGSDLEELEKLSSRVRAERQKRVEEIASLIDDQSDLDTAAAATRRLMFIEKLGVYILDAIESLD